jgi:stage II sporulation protein D
LLLYFPGNLLAGYHNPILKILLFSTSSSVTVSDPAGLRYFADGQRSGYRKRLTIRKFKKNSLRVAGGRVHKGSLWIKGRDKLKISRKNRRGSRHYGGIIEIKPFSRGIYVINHIRTERYLSGVLNAEIDTKWNLEAVKAQAIIARTFALFKRKNRSKSAWHLTANHTDQLYHGDNIADRRGVKAIRMTSGIVVTYNGKLLPTFYHSNCGGKTEDPIYLWEHSYPHLSIKKVPFGKEDPRFYWQRSFSNRQIQKMIGKVGISIGTITDIFVAEKTGSGRAYKLLFIGEWGSNYLLATKFRKLVGYTKLQSLLFKITKTTGGFSFKGKGNGHGVGLCQWAAKEMADDGYTYSEILSFFYDHIRLQTYTSK